MPRNLNTSAPILITGADGFVGHFLLSALLDAGWKEEQIELITRSHVPGLSNFGAQHLLDITDSRKIEDIIKDRKPEAIIHLAAIANPRNAQSSVELAWRTNFYAPLQIANSILKFSPRTRLIFAGSSESYGLSFNRQSSPVTEEMALNPMSVYGATKAACDIALGQAALQGLDVVRFRSFNHTGPSQSSGYVVPAFAEQVARIEQTENASDLVVGNLAAVRDFLDVRDVANAYVKALSFDLSKIDNSAINICSGRGIQIQTIVDILLANTNANITVTHDPEKMRPSEVGCAVGSNDLIRSISDWKPQHEFADTVVDILDYFRKKVR